MPEANLVLIEGYPSKSSEPGGLHIDQFLRPNLRAAGMEFIRLSQRTQPDRVNPLILGPMMLQSSIVPFHGSAKQLPLHLTLLLTQFHKILLENGKKQQKKPVISATQSAGFNRCITKIQDSVQDNLKALQTELSKGKSSVKAQAALDELHYLTSFNQNVSFAMSKSLQHLSDFTFVQMANLTLLRRDAYLENLKPGVKHDTLSALRNSPLSGYALFPDAVIWKAEDEITQCENSKRTSQPGLGQGGFTGGYKKQQQNRFQPYPSNWKQPQDSSRQTGKDMPAWKSFGGRGRSRG